MSHFIEENIYWIMAIVNLIPVLLLVLFVTFRKIRSNPFIIFIKSVFGDMVLFLVLVLVVLSIDMSLARTVVLMIVLQMVYFPIGGMFLLLLSVSSDMNWVKDNWKRMLLSFVILVLWVLCAVIYVIQCRVSKKINLLNSMIK